MQDPGRIAGTGAQGEENAWQAHIRMFTGAAKGAITSETRGQNSALNFGKYGEANRTAKIEDTVFAERLRPLLKTEEHIEAFLYEYWWRTTRPGEQTHKTLTDA